MCNDYGNRIPYDAYIKAFSQLKVRISLAVLRARHARSLAAYYPADSSAKSHHAPPSLEAPRQ
jgi:hypothetical protein